MSLNNPPRSIWFIPLDSIRPAPHHADSDELRSPQAYRKGHSAQRIALKEMTVEIVFTLCPLRHALYDLAVMIWRIRFEPFAHTNYMIR